MKAKQKNLRIFEIEIDDEAAFFPYMEKNLPLLREYLLLLGGEVSEEIERYLQEREICYLRSEECRIKPHTRTPNDQKRAIIEQTPPAPAPEASGVTEPLPTASDHERPCAIAPLVFERTVRSGEMIEHEGGVTIFGRLNSGAKVVARGAVEIYGDVDGMVECEGEYMILKRIGRGHVLFNGDILDAEAFDGTLKRVLKRGESFEIKDLM